MRILLAEDERALSKALVTILKHYNFTVDAVYDGQDAVDYLASEIYDVVLLDIMMPKKDGIAVLKEIRESGNNIPVIMLTAKSQSEDKIAGLDCGADDYVTKPFDVGELVARIRAVARRRDLPCENKLNFGNVVLNPSTCELSVGDNSLRLGHKEFQIMELFLEQPHQIISADRLMDKIWDIDSNAELCVVWVYISGLRKKLSQLSADVTIKASRNIGYSLEKI